MIKEADLLAFGIILEVMHKMYGYDFSQYSQASLKRRILHHVKKKKHETLADIIPELLKSEKAFNELFLDLSITVTEMFRDPFFYRDFCKYVLPRLKTYPAIKIWHAGCATGEEVYSMAILLEEEDCLKRTMLYGTDFNDYALKVAKKGVYPENKMDQYEKNYKDSGGKYSLSKYLIRKYDAVKILDKFQERIMFANHDLIVDTSFGEVEVIVCRNVLIYFNQELRSRVMQLFYDSLSPHGFLCLGDKESLSMTSFENKFTSLNQSSAIYKKASI